MYWDAIEEYMYICVFVISKCPTHKVDTAIVLSSGTLLGSHIPRGCLASRRECKPYCWLN